MLSFIPLTCKIFEMIDWETLHWLMNWTKGGSQYDQETNYVTLRYNQISLFELFCGICYITDSWFVMCHLGRENNFRKVDAEDTTTNGVPYDYWSVMHYGKNAFSNGNGSTIITKDPRFQDIIGQRLEMSPSDVEELNRLYKCGKWLYRGWRLVSTLFQWLIRIINRKKKQADT